MVRTKIRMSFSWPKKQTSVPKYDLEVIRTTDIEERFQLELSNRFSTFREVLDPEALFESITTAIKDIASTNIPVKSSSQPHWMSEETKCAIDDKHKIRKVNGPSEYKIAKAESKKLVKKDKLKQVERDIDLLSSLPLTSNTMQQ